MSDLSALAQKLGTALSGVNNTAELVFVTLAHGGQMDDATILERPDAFPAWDVNWRGKSGAIVQDEGSLYRSIYDITDAVGNTKPSTAPSMWTKIGNPLDGWPEWFQPIGTHDAYPVGAKVSYNGKHWVNSHGDGNIWEPGVYVWTEE
jgi:hypothetical protein